MAGSDIDRNSQWEEQGMIRSRLRRKTIGLCVFVLSLTAFGGGAAQAETGAKWRVNGADVGVLAPQLVIREIENNSASLLFVTSGGTHVLILCTAAEFGQGGKLTANGGISLGDILFRGCVILLNEVFSKNCQVHSPGKPNGELLTEKFNGLIVLDKEEFLLILSIVEGKHELKLIHDKLSELIKITPETGAGAPSKLILAFELGELCAIGEEVNVETTELGEGLWIKDIGGDAGLLTETVTHLVVESLSKLLALGRPAKIIGSTVLELGGAHAGLKWSGVPA